MSNSDVQQQTPRPSRQVDLSVIVPTYNERENIEVLLCLLHEHLNQARNLQDQEKDALSQASLSWEVIIVDDNSPDGTAELVTQLQRTGPEFARSKVFLVKRKGKLGLGTAYSAGLKEARGEWVVLMDADLSHNPKYLPIMLQKQATTGCDIVSGTRYKAGGGVSGWNWKRKLTSRGANLLAAILLGAHQSDLTGAYRLYRRSCLEVLLKECTCKGYAFQMEVAVRAQYHKYTVQEVPIVFVDRLYGTSKLGAAEFVGFLKGLVTLFFTL